MSPILHPDHAGAHADETQLPAASFPTGTRVMDPVRQATSPPSFSTTIQMDTSVPPSISTTIQTDSSVPPSLMPPALVSDVPSSGPFKTGMTLGTKIGLGMIPVVVFLCALWIFFLFWWRKRRMRKAIRHMGPPPVPEKDQSSLGGSMHSSQRGSKVFNMAAFSTPVHDGRYREAQVFGRDRMQDQAANINQNEKDKISATIARLASSDSADRDVDSPIDRKSPFRLKRGDTLKRCSLGTEISSLWPSPPPSAWVKQPVKIDRVVSPPLSPASPSYQPQPARAKN